eukprot:15434615-Alexandrium_andersonii.AAC.1
MGMLRRVTLRHDAGYNVHASITVATRACSFTVHRSLAQPEPFVLPGPLSVGQWRDALEEEASARFPAARRDLQGHIAD